jgi:hypothetical protein
MSPDERANTDDGARTDVPDLGAAPDPVADAAVAALLADLPPVPMPAPVWDRLSRVLAAEQAARAAAGSPAGADASADVVPIGTRTARREEARTRRTRLLGGLVAAAVVVVAAGLGLSALRGTSPGPAPVAAGAAEDAAVDGGAAPALQITRTGTNYAQASFDDQVADLLASDEVQDTLPRALGAASGEAAVPVEAEDVAPVGEDGFTSSWAGLRACVAGLAGSAQVQAIVVDRATYEGRDAGVVVLPTVRTTATVDVWVVEPGCGQADPRVLFFFRAPVGG